MKALITGATSGLGLSFAKQLSETGHELILVGRDKAKLESIQRQLKTKTKGIVMDLSKEANVKSLYVLCKNEDIDILINNAGFGMYGAFDTMDLTTELEMIELNIKALHILTKLFLRDMKKKNKGYILNVASLASFYPGPFMATYYATKNYVRSLTEAIYQELKEEKRNVVVSCLCPGPIATNFNRVAKVQFRIKAMKSDDVATYALKEMLEHQKRIIIPGIKLKLLKWSSRFIPSTWTLKVTRKMQQEAIQKEN